MAPCYDPRRHMQARRIVWFSVSSLALASWLASATTTSVRPPVVPLPPPKSAPLDRSVAVLQSEMSRLHARLAPTAAPSRSRDLFRFSVRPVERRRAVASPRPAPVAAESDVVPVAAPRPVLSLIGVAEDTDGATLVRTAILSGPGDVYLVKPGETLRGQFRVEQVSADAVQLTDTASNQRFTLTLR